MSDTSHQDAIRFEQEMIALSKLEELIERFEASVVPLRDQFAMAALTGMLAGPNGDADCGPEGMAHDAYLFADEMLAARADDDGKGE